MPALRQEPAQRQPERCVLDMRGERQDGPRERRCLKCGLMFGSAGISNRLCERCKHLNQSVMWKKPARGGEQ